MLREQKATLSPFFLEGSEDNLSLLPVCASTALAPAAIGRPYAVVSACQHPWKTIEAADSCQPLLPGNKHFLPFSELSCRDIHNGVAKQHESVPVANADLHSDSVVPRQAKQLARSVETSSAKVAVLPVDFLIGAPDNMRQLSQISKS
jgi:hypothetical protein